MTEPITDESARALRALWFDFMDEIEPIRPKLHAYCLRLSGSVWEAEDLAQESLLRAFAVMGRGDLHGEHSRFDRADAYLCQIATNLWIDRLRRQRREAAALANLQTGEVAAVAAGSDMITPAAGAALFEFASPQERAAVVLKDVFDFSLAETADILATTPGAVKSALARGRSKLADERPQLPHRASAASPALVERFIAAFNARDMAAVVALLLEPVTWEVQGVGGERGRDTIWLKVRLPRSLVAAAHVIDGELIVVFTAPDGEQRVLTGVERIEESEDRICRIVNYGFCTDTVEYVAAYLGLGCRPMGYHQDPPTLANMIADTKRPWRLDSPGG
jgi:RNA polymerase sigma-70 factor (ECF subfamily)